MCVYVCLSEKMYYVTSFPPFCREGEGLLIVMVTVRCEALHQIKCDKMAWLIIPSIPVKESSPKLLFSHFFRTEHSHPTEKF